MHRVNIYRVVADRGTLRPVRAVADRCNVLWNAVQYLCRQRFFERTGVPTYAELCALFGDNGASRALPSDIAREALKKVRESWASCFENLRNSRDGKLDEPPGIPRYWKDRRTGERILAWIPIKCARSHAIDGDEFSMTAPRDLSGERLRMRIRGCTHWRGKPGRAEIVWDPGGNMWYLRQSVEATMPAGRARPRRWAAIDRGARVPVALAIQGTAKAPAFRSREVWKDPLDWSRKIAGLQGTLGARGRHTSRKLRRLPARRGERLLSASRALAREVVRVLKAHHVTGLLVGDLTGIREDRDFGPLNGLVHTFWRFAELLDALRDACGRAGIQVRGDAPGRGTSSPCALCGRPAARPIRSRVLCRGGHELHAGVNGALNLLSRGPEVRARAEGRPAWCTLRWNGHRRVPTESARRGLSPGGLHAALAA